MSGVLVRSLCGLFVVVSLLGCPPSEMVVPEPIKITITPSVASIVADGTNSLTITVKRASGATDVRLSASLGSIESRVAAKRTTCVRPRDAG